MYNFDKISKDIYSYSRLKWIGNWYDHYVKLRESAIYYFIINKNWVCQTWPVQSATTVMLQDQYPLWIGGVEFYWPWVHFINKSSLEIESDGNFALF